MSERLKYYNSLSRWQLMQFSTNLANTITPEVIRNSQRPFLITINGMAPKSLFWDFMMSALLGKTKNIVSEKTNIPPPEKIRMSRYYETWEGNHKAGNKSLTIFLCNPKAKYSVARQHSKKHKHIEQSIENLRSHLRGNGQGALQELKTLGDILILSNTGSTLAGDLDISIINRKIPDFIDYTPLTKWYKSIAVNINNQQLKSSIAMKSFRNNYRL